MKAAILYGPYDIRIQEMPEPKISSRDVLVKVSVCGICGSDLHAYKGLHPDFVIPIIPGHEFSGVVKEVGEDVKKIKPGDRVVVEPLKVCNECYFCQRGEYNRCLNLKVIGAQTNGALSEYVAVNEKFVYKMPNNMSFEIGAMVEPTAVAIHAVRRVSRVGDIVLVLGAGTIGLLTAQVAKEMGASKVIITDVLDWKLDVAKKLGIDYTVNVREEDLEDIIREVTGNIGVDTSFEAVGLEETLNQALTYTRKGGNIVVIGVFERSPKNFKIMNIVNNELTIYGSLIYAWDYEKAIDFISTGRVKVEPLISKKVPLDEVKLWFDRLISREKGLIKVQVAIN